MPSECQTVWIQTVCTGYLQTTQVGKELKDININKNSNVIKLYKSRFDQALPNLICSVGAGCSFLSTPEQLKSQQKKD